MTLGSFWFSYVILITILSGMLVLFIYIARVASNEKFFSSIKLTTLIIILIILGFIYEIITERSIIEIIKIISNIKPEEIRLNNLFNINNKFIVIILVIYLFITIVTVSLIVNISEGPLRVNKK